MEQTVVLFPTLGAGHITPMAQLGKLFLRRGFHVVIALISDASVQATTNSDVIARVTSGFSVHQLQPVQVDETLDRLTRYREVIRLSSLHLGDYLLSLSGAAALVVDLFCAGALDVAAAVGVPGYIYFTSGASVLAAFMRMLSSGSTITDEEVRIPGLPAIRTSDVPPTFWKPEFRSVLSRLSDGKAILVNSFEWLEANAAKAIRDGAVGQPDSATPPVYCIGPLVGAGGEEGGGERHECLAWLDGQPDCSVVFLCFGSAGAFPAEQIKEIAVGMEKSGQRFLWVVRGASPDGGRQSFSLPPPDLDALLPGGFLERAKSVGMVVKSWAPQSAVLQHKATAAFVTHCGWNSTLEAVAAGMPMVCWPLYAEQRLNKVFIVEDMKLGVEMVGYDKEMVSAEEIETKVRWVMESPEGKELRRRLSEAKERAAEALSDGGPSVAAFDKFITDAALTRTA